MKIINLETCDRQILRDLGIQFTDCEIRRMSVSNLNEDWTEVHASVDKDTIPEGAVILDAGAYYGEYAIAVKEGKVIGWAECPPCPWWDDSIAKKLCIPAEGERVTRFSLSINSTSFDVERDCWELSATVNPEDVREALRWGGAVLSPDLLREAGADKDATEVAALVVAAEKTARKARYEAAKERAELLYPYNGAKVFRARIRWALEDGVSEAAKALAPYVKSLRPHLRPLGGWPCHYRQIPAAWRRAYGWGAESDAALDALMGVCKLTQPRLDAAWEVACVLAR